MYVAIKDEKIIAISKTDDTFPCLVCDEIKEIDDIIENYIDVGSEFVLKTDSKAIKKQQEDVRQIRNQYLEQTDKFLSISDYPIDDETKELYKQYRQYLRDIPSNVDFPNIEILSFDEWTIDIVD